MGLLQEALKGFSPEKFLPPVTSSEQHFRNKAKFSITGTLENPIIGLLGEDDLDLGRDIRSCPLHHTAINEVAKNLDTFIQLTRLEPYQIKLKRGELKGVIIYHSSQSEAMYLRFILRSKEGLDRIRKHLSFLLNQFKFLKCVSVNIQPIPHAILEGEEEIILTSENYILHDLKEVRMALHPQGFVQTNQEMAAKLYSTAASWVNDLSVDKFIELFSGQGAFSFFVQKHVKQALGVEINQEAVLRANQTAEVLNLDHLKFVARDARLVENEILSVQPDLILVNPPRRGVGTGRTLLLKSRCRYIIYSSCNYKTLKEDLEALSDLYTIRKVQLFDMFPHTEHFETLTLLELNGLEKNTSSR